VRDLPRSPDASSDDGGDGDSDKSETAVQGNGRTAAATPRRPWRAAHARTAVRPEGGALRRSLRGDGVRTDEGDGASDDRWRSPDAEPAGDGAASVDALDVDDDQGAEGAGWRLGRRGKHAKKRKQPRSLRRTILEWVGVIGGGVIIALVIEALLVQAFWIPSPSMVPTLNVGDRVLVNKLSYRLHDVHRGDLIVFERPPESSGNGENDIRDLIKRVIAVGGDTIEQRNNLVYVNGDRVDEPYLEPGTPTENLPRQTIPEGHVFVMGDNRTNSEDSRVFGPVDEDRIVGRAFVRVLPLGDIGWL
jgi:signal peptidase I